MEHFFHRSFALIKKYKETKKGNWFDVLKAYVVCYCYRMHALKTGLDQQRAMEQLNGVANEVTILRLAIAKKELPAPSLHIDPKLAHRAKMEETQIKTFSKGHQHKAEGERGGRKQDQDGGGVEDKRTTI